MNTNVERTTYLKLALLCLGLVSALSTMSAKADTVTAVSNLNQPGTPGNAFGSNGFTTGDGPGWFLENLQVSLFRNTSAGSGSDDVTMSLFQDSTLLGQSTLSISSTTPTAYAFSFTTPIILDPNTTYTLSRSGANTFWTYTDSQSEDSGGLPGWSIGAMQGNALAGNAAFKFAVDVAPVPLPAAAWLFGSALLGVVGLGYRNRKQSAA